MQIRVYTPTSHKVKALVYGASGSGKTSFAGTAKDALFLSAEGGLLSLAEKAVSYVDIHSLRDLEEALVFLQKNPSKFKTVIIDSISEINDIIMNEIERRTGRKMQIQDFGELSQKIKSLLRRFRDLDMHVLFLALEKSLTDNDKVIKVVPEVSGKAATGIAQFMDIVGYISASNTGERSILTATDPLYLTKDRSQKLADAPLDFEKWIEAVQTIKTGEQKVVYSDFLLPEQVSRINNLWQEYGALTETDPEKIPAIIVATLKRDFSKRKVEELTPEEAEIHINGFIVVVNRLKAEQMKEDELEYGGGSKSPEELAADLADREDAKSPAEPVAMAATPAKSAKEIADDRVKEVIATKAARKAGKPATEEKQTDAALLAECDKLAEEISNDEQALANHEENPTDTSAFRNAMEKLREEIHEKKNRLTALIKKIEEKELADDDQTN